MPVRVESGWESGMGVKMGFEWVRVGGLGISAKSGGGRGWGAESVDWLRAFGAPHLRRMRYIIAHLHVKAGRLRTRGC